MEKIKISVIIPTYNRLGSLRAQLEALLRQSYPLRRYEVIVINDGSSDGTQEYLDNQKVFNPNLIVINQRNGGPAKARNRGLKIAKGPIIAFTDDDCVVNSNWLEIIDQQFQSNIVGIQGLTYTDKKMVTPLTHQIDNETGHNSVPTCNAAYLKDKLLEIGGFDILI